MDVRSSIRAATRRSRSRSRWRRRVGRAAVPSGASTGEHEAVELRDGDPARYLGKGVAKAVENVNGEIAQAIAGVDASDQRAIDRAADRARRHAEQGEARRERDPRRLAGRGASRGRRRSLPLYRYLGGADARTLPVPLMNISTAGARGQRPRLPGVHDRAGRRAPRSRGAAVRRRGVPHAEACSTTGLSTGVGDEGGFAPDLESRRARRSRRSSKRSSVPGTATRSASRSTPRPASSTRRRVHLAGRSARSRRRRWSSSMRAGRAVSDHLDRGRAGRGRLGGLEDAHRRARRGSSSSATTSS